MQERAWKSKIVKHCKAAETYQPYFDPVISKLANIMAKRDEAEEEFMSGDNTYVMEMTTKSGTYLQKHPLISMINDLDKTALSYWKELGLTPAALKRLKDTQTTGRAQTLADVLKDIGD